MAVKEARGLKQRKEDVMLAGLNDADDPGAAAEVIKNRGLSLDEEAMARAKKRRPIGPFTINPLGEKEQEIERKLSTPVSLNFKDAPLQQVINDLRDYNALNIVIDEPALREDGISLDSPLSIQLNQVSLKSARHRSVPAPPSTIALPWSVSTSSSPLPEETVSKPAQVRSTSLPEPVIRWNCSKLEKSTFGGGSGTF